MLGDLRDDDGWDQELAPGTRSSRIGILQRHLASRGLILRYRGVVYIYLGAINAWGSLASPGAQRQICDMLGLDNVSTGFTKAVSTYYSFIDKNARRISSIPMSICIGTRRLMIEIDKDGKEMKFGDCTGIATIDEGLDSRISGFCQMPCSFTCYSLGWKMNGDTYDCRMYRYLQVLFHDKTELRTIMWIIGLCAVDPSRISKFLLLYGPTGTGKSEVVRMIGDIMPGCSGTIANSQLHLDKYSKNADMTSTTAEAIVSSRILTSSELNLLDNKLNCHVIKEMTGHDSISVPPLRATARCSIVTSSNHLPDPIRQPEWLNDTAVARRAVIVPMDIDTKALPKAECPDSEEDCLAMLYSCVREYIHCGDVMPMSKRSLLLSILGNTYGSLSSIIISDDDATEEQVIEANTQLSVRLDISVDLLGELAELRSREFVSYIGGRRFISGIRYIGMTDEA